jgi:hypothetical protein
MVFANQNAMQKIMLFLLAAFIFFQCRENDDVQPKSMNVGATTPGNYYVTMSGDNSNDGSIGRPWRSLKYAAANSPAGSTINLAAGNYVEEGQVQVPAGVNIFGAGIGQTVIRIAGPYYYHPDVPEYAADKYLINLTSDALSAGNQTIGGFTIDGDAKQLHGGIFVRNRTNVTLTGVRVQDTNFNGIWLWNIQDSKLLDTQLANCSWGSNEYSVGALNIGDLTRVEIANVNIDESRGYGIKAMGPEGNNNIINTKIHDCHISVEPAGHWNNGIAPNFAMEAWAVNLVGSELYNNYFDNTLSIVNEHNVASTGAQTVRVHHNTFDLGARAKGAGFAVELTYNDVEFDHNYFFKGTQGIVNWATTAQQNWSIHHNTFFQLEGKDPGEVLRAEKSGLHNVVFYNNTIEFASDKTMNVIGIYGGTSDNVDVKNNLIINNSWNLNHYPNEFIHVENSAQINGLYVRNNLLWKMAMGNVAGTYSDNKTQDPNIQGSGNRPGNYYMPNGNSPLINAGLSTGNAFSGSAPDIGAMEFAGGTSETSTLAVSKTVAAPAVSAQTVAPIVTTSETELKSEDLIEIPISRPVTVPTAPRQAGTLSPRQKN